MHKQDKLNQVNDRERVDRELRLYYALTAIIGLVIVAFILNRSNFSFSLPLELFIRILCDGFFVSGMILFSIWLIAWGWYHGLLDIFLYSFALMFSPFQKEPDKRNKETRDFVTYQQHKKLERRQPTHLLIVGAIFLAISILLYVLFILL